MSTTDTAKRSAYDDKLTVEGGGDGGGANNSPATKRLKTDATITDPTSEVVLNPDILSKALLCIDISEVPPVAQTCKVWKYTLDAVEQTLWKGLVEKHCPSLIRITNMLPDSGGEDKPNISVKGIPVPSKNWKSQFKRRVMVKPGGAKSIGKTKPLESYLFEVRCRSIFAPKRQETITFIESVEKSDGPLGYLAEAWDIVLRGFRLPENVDKDEALVTVYLHDRSTGRHTLFFVRRGDAKG